MIKVIRPGVLTTIQDRGRFGYQSAGVISSGVMDRYAYQIANRLVGEKNAAVLEMTAVGAVLSFQEDAVIAITGADMSPTVNGIAIPMWRPIFIKQGSELRCGSAKHGFRTYVAVAGGLDVPLVMGSRSTYLRAAIGGFEGRALLAGDRIALGRPTSWALKLFEQLERGFQACAEKVATFANAPHSIHSAYSANLLNSAHSSVYVPAWSLSEGMRPLYDRTEQMTVRILPGHQQTFFTAEALETLVTKPFRILPQSDRMGYRLQGDAALTLREPLELLSTGVAFGTIQVSPDGQPIILMADSQTTGGYPVIGHVISVDWPILAQVAPGSSIRFQWIDFEGAELLQALELREDALLWASMRLKLNAAVMH